MSIDRVLDKLDAVERKMALYERESHWGLLGSHRVFDYKNMTDKQHDEHDRLKEKRADLLIQLRELQQ